MLVPNPPNSNIAPLIRGDEPVAVGEAKAEPTVGMLIRIIRKKLQVVSPYSLPVTLFCYLKHPTITPPKHLGVVRLIADAGHDVVGAGDDGAEQVGVFVGALR